MIHTFNNSFSFVVGLLLFDLVGMVARWGGLDHAAHIGGMLFGIWWITEGRISEIMSCKESAIFFANEQKQNEEFGFDFF